GTPIEMWMHHEDTQKSPEDLKLFRARYAKRVGWREGGMYNAMIRPLQNLRFSGVIWYQGWPMRLTILRCMPSSRPT
ncbi:MAG: hypothetical protein J6R73_00820, partial [Alistipes sp.]|nr:hypothetical protein [Alistipes sp.]